MSISFVNLSPGDPAPWFRAASFSNPSYAFDTAAGRYVLLCFFGTAGDETGQRALKAIAVNRHLFDDSKLCVFGVSLNVHDTLNGRIRESLPGIRFFLDHDGTVSRLYGTIPQEQASNERILLRRLWILLDPTLRVLKIVPMRDDGGESSELFSYLSALPPVDLHTGISFQAPVLYLPNVFESDFCERLIDIYDANGGEESGFMREIDGKTVGVTDYNHKRRRDYNIEDQEVIAATQARIKRRIVPEIAKAYQFHVTRMERYIVGCYTAEDGGHFRAHRDNTTKGTAHRRFAISINLNSEFDGGEVSFPEYGPRSFKPPPGGAVVFSCSLLHAVSRVTAGRRYAFLPFVYDDEAAKLREQNNPFLDQRLGKYRGA